MRINEFQLTEHFSLVEFQCPCCHTVLLAPRLVLMLEALRQTCGGGPRRGSRRLNVSRLRRVKNVAPAAAFSQ